MTERENQTTATPPGMVGIFTDKLGRVIETVSDFSADGYGGCSLREAQTYRVKTRLALAVVRAYCSEMILDGLETHDCERIVQRLVTKGATTTFIPVGYADDER
jgi:hypothetical protein